MLPCTNNINSNIHYYVHRSSVKLCSQLLKPVNKEGGSGVKEGDLFLCLNA